MPPSPQPIAVQSPRDRGVGLAILALAVAVGAWYWLSPRSVERPARDRQEVFLEETLSATTGVPPAATLRVRVLRPSMLAIRVDGGEGRDLSASFGPERPVELGAVPDTSVGTTWTVTSAAPEREVPAYGAGLYVLRIEGAPAPRVRIVVRPWR